MSVLLLVTAIKHKRCGKNTSNNPARGENSPRKKRPYKGTIQAEVAALTAQRIIQAGMELFDEQWGDTITLEQIAERASVTTQTLLRHFGSKEHLADMISQEAFRQSQHYLLDPSEGDISNIAASIVIYYEASGRRMLRGLAQEERYPELHTIIDFARNSHKLWLERVFTSSLAPLDAGNRTCLLAQLYTLTSVYTWHMLRNDCNLTVDEAARVLQDMLNALLTTKN